VSAHDVAAGVTATPVKVLRFADADGVRGLDVVPGRTYVLRTDAQDVDGGAVTYPLCWVGEGTAGQELRANQGAPFHRLLEARITPRVRWLLVTVEAACTVWVHAVDDGARLAGQPSCSACGPVPEPTAKSACGCARV